MERFISNEIQQKYNSSLDRYTTAMRNGTPDRIPIRFLFQEAAARHANITNQQAALDYNLVFEATRNMAKDMDSDAVMLNAIWSNYGVAKAAGWKYLAVPGVDIDKNSTLQFWEPKSEEDQFLLIDEYDEFTDDPTAFLFTKWLPRATTRTAMKGSPVTFEHNVSLMSGAIAYTNYMHAFGPAANKLKYEAGIVSANAGMIKAPLDILGDKFRGYIGSATDTIERPEKVLAACESLIPHIIANALAGADPEKNVPITLWAHRGCVPFYSMETFNNIFWPTLKPVLEELISKGHQILFYGEGDWAAHYDALLELPAGSIIYHMDKADPALAASKLKRKFALSGGVSYDILARKTPADVREHLKTLFSQVACDGGYILDATALMMSDISPENVRAAVDYTLENGVYSQCSCKKATEQCRAFDNIRLLSSRYPDEYTSISHEISAGKRPPNVCIPWEDEKSGYRALNAEHDDIKVKWQEVDAGAYNYIWTTLLW